jgi:hypothetical protein
MDISSTGDGYFPSKNTPKYPKAIKNMPRAIIIFETQSILLQMDIMEKGSFGVINIWMTYTPKIAKEGKQFCGSIARNVR